MQKSSSEILFFLVLFYENSQITGQHGKGEAILLTSLYHFRLLHRHLDSPLHIASATHKSGPLDFQTQVANH